MTPDQIAETVTKCLDGFPLVVTHHMHLAPTLAFPGECGCTITITGNGNRLTLMAHTDSLVAHFVPTWFKDNVASTRKFGLTPDEILAGVLKYFVEVNRRKKLSHERAIARIKLFTAKIGIVPNA